ncbi:hypothetical protein RFI_29751 [Reticulomyxa filosa]|uniref:Uncharacterized protein n=1 Tax=Reticulomyxa filosa TaxID=46433 RepID=X6M3N9_RETFI|nr:hypothetical protein RFI_29751 [Reticulomyxa filosa]|eukprot:ETO07640.1 hypothetical protein RFI_29751 [Reticulomyxa filosa]
MIHLSDEKWKHLEIEEGDEIECYYSINESSTVTIHDIQFPEMYSKGISVFAYMSKFKNGNKGGLLESWMAPNTRETDVTHSAVWFFIFVNCNRQFAHFCFALFYLDLNRRKMRAIPLSGSAMQALKAFNDANQASNKRSCCIYFIFLFV